jgi:hypothetical protein
LKKKKKKVEGRKGVWSPTKLSMLRGNLALALWSLIIGANA